MVPTETLDGTAARILRVEAVIASLTAASPQPKKRLAAALPALPRGHGVSVHRRGSPTAGRAARLAGGSLCRRPPETPTVERSAARWRERRRTGGWVLGGIEERRHTETPPLRKRRIYHNQTIHAGLDVKRRPI